MGKPHYKILLLFLASDNTPLYRNFKKIHEGYMHARSDVKFAFAYSDVHKGFMKKEYDHVFGKRFSTLRETMVNQTVHAIEAEKKVCDFDFLVRTNLSTFWMLDRLIKRVDSIVDYSSIYGRTGQNPPIFVVGQDIVVHKTLFERLLVNKDEVLTQGRDFKLKAEDRLFSEYYTETLKAALVDHSKNILVLERFSTIGEDIDLYVQEKIKDEKVDHVRVKNMADRENVDVYIMKKLLKICYDKELDDGDVQ